MNEFRFEHLRNREPAGFPRPILFIGVCIVFLAFLLVQVFRHEEGAMPPGGAGDTSVPSGAVSPDQVAPADRPADAGGIDGTRADTEADLRPGEPIGDIAGSGADQPAVDEGILSVRGEGSRIIPPRLMSGERPSLPGVLLEQANLTPPSLYVRLDREGRVTHVSVVSSSGNDELDRIICDGLKICSFQPALSDGRPVEFASVIVYPLRKEEPQPVP